MSAITFIVATAASCARAADYRRNRRAQACYETSVAACFNLLMCSRACLTASCRLVLIGKQMLATLSRQYAINFSWHHLRGVASRHDSATFRAYWPKMELSLNRVASKEYIPAHISVRRSDGRKLVVGIIKVLDHLRYQSMDARQARHAARNLPFKRDVRAGRLTRQSMAIAEIY